MSVGISTFRVYLADPTQRISENLRQYNGIFHVKTFEYGVLRMQSAYSLIMQFAVGGGKGSTMNLEAKRVTEASSEALQGINDELSAVQNMTISKMINAI